MSWLILRIAVLAVGIYLAAYIVPGITVAGYGPVIKGAVILGAFQIIIKPVLLLLTIPINILSMGLFTLFLNGFLLWMASAFIAGFNVSGVFPAVLGAIIISILTIFVNIVKPPDHGGPRGGRPRVVFRRW